MDLVQIAEKVVEALSQRVAGTVGKAKAPFAVTARRIACRLEDLGQGDILIPQVGVAKVPTNGSVAPVEARDQDAPRGRTDSRSGIGLREPHPLRGKPVQMGCPDPVLPVGAEVPVAQVIGHDQDDVRLRRDSCREQESENHGGEHPCKVSRSTYL